VNALVIFRKHTFFIFIFIFLFLFLPLLAIRKHQSTVFYELMCCWSWQWSRKASSGASL